MHAEIVMIGTELLLGEIVDTNAALLAKALRGIGLDLLYKTTVGDNEGRITAVLNLALDRSDVVITSGGLGPTLDDVTRQAVANATGRRLVYSAELEAQIAERFRSFGRRMAENNKRQAYLPEGALPIENPAGTAPCFLAEDTGGRGFVIVLPGVTRELEYLLEHAVLPLLAERLGGAKATRVRVLRTCAVGESNVDRAIGDLMGSANPTVGLAAHAGQTDVRITAKADTEAEAQALIAAMEARVRERLGVSVYGVERETVPEVVGRLLAERGLALGVVDTLTAGLLAGELTKAGFGDVLRAGFLAADPAAAAGQLGVETPDGTGPEAFLALAARLAERVAPEGGLGLALLGPLEGATCLAVHGPGELRFQERGRNFKDSSYVRRWLAIQGLDRVRRAVLGQLSSPADWEAEPF